MFLLVIGAAASLAVAVRGRLVTGGSPSSVALGSVVVSIVFSGLLLRLSLLPLSPLGVDVGVGRLRLVAAVVVAVLVVPFAAVDRFDGLAAAAGVFLVVAAVLRGGILIFFFSRCTWWCAQWSPA